jgi:4-amino-4-deoxy-L-arabinose transferase-like glycosyltransferase
MKHTRKEAFPFFLFFILVYLLFLIKGFLYASITPLWEGIDEPFHFAYIQSLAANKSLPVWGETFLDTDIARSTAYVPLPPLMPQLVHGKKLSYADYWQMQPEQQKELQKDLFALQADTDKIVPSPVRLYQVQHPPLYYLLCVPFYKLMNSSNLLEKVFALRLFSIFIASLSVIAAALVGRRFGLIGTLMLALMVLLPGFYVDVARVGNDSLGAAIFSFIFALLCFYDDRPSASKAFLAGILLGLGLLTKAYFLAAIPATIAFFAFLFVKDRQRQRSILIHACILILCAAALGGWWYARNYLLYGTFSGLQESIYFPSVGLSARIRAALQVNWLLILKHLFVTFSWVSGWSFLHLPKPAYAIFIVLFITAGGGLLKYLFNQKEHPLKNHAFVAAALLIGFFTLGVAYHEVNVKATVKIMGGPGGWYFYALAAPISYILALGLAHPGRVWARWSFLLLSAGLVLTELYGFFRILLPHYAGLARPAADGWGLQLLGHLPVGKTLARLLVDKPAILSPAIVAVVLALCVILYLGMIIAWMMMTREMRHQGDQIPQEEVLIAADR